MWHKTSDRVDADVQGIALWPLLEKVAVEAGWHIYVEPDTDRKVSTKFKNLSSNEALKMLLGELNFALQPQTNGSTRLYVFRTKLENATRQVQTKLPRHVANELIVHLKPGTNIDALAKLLGAKVTGRIDSIGLYRLQFPDAATTDTALGELKNNSDVVAVDFNNYFDPPPVAQAMNAAPLGPVNLQLTPSTDTSKVVVGLVDTTVQPLGDLEKFISKRVSVADGTPAGSDLLHGTGMAETILRAIAGVNQNSSVQIIAADVYGSGESTTTWNVALGFQAVINNGATVINMSLGGAGESSMLNGLIQQAIAAGIPVYAAAGNEPVTTPTYPAAYPGVLAVTSVQNGQLAPYANYGSFVDMALPGSSVVYLGNQAYMMQGTSVSTAYATGVAAGNKATSGATWPQVTTAMEKKFPVPAK